MYWVADILLVAFLGLFLYRGIKKGFLNSTFNVVIPILNIVFGIATAFALVFFVFDWVGWLEDLQNAFYDFAQSLAGIVELLGLGVATVDIAHYLAIGIPTLILFIPMYAFWRFVSRQFERFVKWVRSKVLFFKILGSVLGGVINFAFAAVLVVGFYWLFASLDGSGLFTYTNDVLRSGYLTGLVYEYNPLFLLDIGAPGWLGETVGNIISGDFLYK